jgi:hypothetical protein
MVNDAASSAPRDIDGCLHAVAQPHRIRFQEPTRFHVMGNDVRPARKLLVLRDIYRATLAVGDHDLGPINIEDG